VTTSAIPFFIFVTTIVPVTWLTEALFVAVVLPVPVPVPVVCELTVTVLVAEVVLEPNPPIVLPAAPDGTGCPIYYIAREPC
jgi:hypothetical protein